MFNDMTDWGDDLLDSRDIIARFNDLDGYDDEDLAELDPDEAEEIREELAQLADICGQGESYSDWLHGITMVHDRYFEQYARDFADDIGAIDSDAGWPACHIDWEAAAASLQADYGNVEHGGHTYWVR